MDVELTEYLYRLFSVRLQTDARWTEFFIGKCSFSCALADDGEGGPCVNLHLQRSSLNGEGCSNWCCRLSCDQIQFFVTLSAIFLRDLFLRSTIPLSRTSGAITLGAANCSNLAFLSTVVASSVDKVAFSCFVVFAVTATAGLLPLNTRRCLGIAVFSQ